MWTDLQRNLALIRMAHARCRISQQTMIEEVLNVLTHRLALVFSGVGLILMTTMAALHGSALHIVATTGFCVLLVLLFTTSMLYHAADRIEQKRLYRMLDHMAIFLVIAGTYTPFMLVIHRHPVAWPVFWTMWGVALVGIVAKIFTTGRYRILSTLGYLGMGWMMAVAVDPLQQTLTPAGFMLLVAGAASYSLGTVFFLWRTLPFGHVLWHLAVMGGAGCHYFAVLTLVV